MTNNVVRYNISANAWEWTKTEGEIPYTMSDKLSIKKSDIQLPFKTANHVAVTWNAAMIIWEMVESRLCFHVAGKWIEKKMTGDIPEPTWVAPHVSNDHMYVIQGLN